MIEESTAVSSFSGMALLIHDKLRNNDRVFFQRFTYVRKEIEDWLIDNKSLIGVLIQNLNKGQRIPKVRDLLNFLVTQFEKHTKVSPEAVLSHLGAKGRVFDITVQQAGAHFSDDTKSTVFIERAIASALRCPICDGLLDPTKSVHYDHKVPLRDGGRGDVANAQLVHPYCNSGIKA
jgi:hypothetical protein